jgi:hypothetical protein
MITWLIHDCNGRRLRLFRGGFHPPNRGPAGPRSFGLADQLTPSFFCRLEEEVVYWNTKRFSG